MKNYKINNNMEAILFETLDKMKNNFSSNEFSTKARRLGLNKRAVANGIVAAFLHLNAIQGETRRMWSKKTFTFKKTPTIEKAETEVEKINAAILLLKKNGYKILKEVSEWINL
jgi:hypothetical protein